MSDSASTLSGRDWDVVPQDKWNIDMCIRWLRGEVKWSEEEIEAADAALERLANPGVVLRFGDISSLLNGISIGSIASLRAKNILAPHTPGTTYSLYQ